MGGRVVERRVIALLVVGNVINLSFHVWFIKLRVVDLARGVNLLLAVQVWLRFLGWINRDRLGRSVESSELMGNAPHHLRGLTLMTS
jgi:hypothetical protein